jgi:hypothetical protein
MQECKLQSEARRNRNYYRTVHRNLPILASFSAGRLKNFPYSPPLGLGRLANIFLKACLVAEANTRRQLTNVNLRLQKRRCDIFIADKYFLKRNI